MRSYVEELSKEFDKHLEMLKLFMEKCRNGKEKFEKQNKLSWEKVDECEIPRDLLTSKDVVRVSYWKLKLINKKCILKCIIFTMLYLMIQRKSL